jgi:hypothetical protein
MAVLIDELEVVSAAPAEPGAGEAGGGAPRPQKSETMETVLQRLEERCARVWAH